MKKTKLLLLIVASIIVTGCLKTEMSVKINSDKSYVIGSKIEMSKSVLESMGEFGGESSGPSVFDEKEIAEKRNEGYEIDVSEDEENKIIKYEKKFNNLDDITSETRKEVNLAQSTDEMEDSDGTLEGQILFNSADKKTYKSNIVFNYPSSEGAEMFADSIKTSFKLELPVKPVSHNATETLNDGKTLVWNITYGKSQNIDFEFDLNKSSNPLNIIGIGNASKGGVNLVLIGGIIGFVALFVIIVLLAKKKRGAMLTSGFNNPTPNDLNRPFPSDPQMMPHANQSDPLPMANEAMQNSQPQMNDVSQPLPSMETQEAMVNPPESQQETIFQQTSPTNEPLPNENPQMPGTGTQNTDVFPENK